MRRIGLLFLASAALAAPAAALAAKDASGDGTLVVRNGEAPFKPADPSASTPVVKLTNFTGSVIGQVTGQGRIFIDGGAKSPLPEVTGPNVLGKDVPQSDTARVWNGGADGFKFRAVGGTYTIVIYGAKVNLVAIGTGTVVLAGRPDTPVGDGRYSLNGKDFQSLPGTPSGKLVVGDASNG
jgi:hypothetical protein